MSQNGRRMSSMELKDKRAISKWMLGDEVPMLPTKHA